MYEEPGPEDGLRILVDRLWPRGFSKNRLVLDQWAKGLAPSPGRFEEFTQRYRTELTGEPEVGELNQLRRIAGNQPITLLTATRDVGRSGAAVAAEVLRVGTEKA